MKARLFFAALMLAIAVATACGQRRVTPVIPAEPAGKSEQPVRRTDRPVDPARMAHYHDADGNVVLVDTVTGAEWVDSTAIRRTGYVYPRLYALTVGLDLWDPLMRALGQNYGLTSVWAEVSFHNRFNPYVEIGVGTADDTPEAMNFTFKSPVAPFFKIGANYNFLYNSNPAYQVYAGVRYGFTRFSYRLENVTDNDGYWGEDLPLAFPRSTSSVGFFEIGFGIKVMIARNWSLGWMGRYHSILHETKSALGDPMIIPGYGKRKNSLAVALSLMYTIPLNRKSAPVVNNADE